MIRRLTRTVIGGLLALGALAAACGDTVSGKDCKVSCQDVDNTCVQKCNDDACKTKCATDLDNCTASCSTVTVSPSDGGK
jgi:hypothetical protein